MVGFREDYERALTLAARAHQGQTRKGSDIPYLVHPVHVSTILLRHGYPQDAVLAGLLHDVVEDSGIPLARIEAAFGPSVADIVATLTERKREEDGAGRPWEARKREALAELRRASPAALAVKAADIIHNTHTLASQLRDRGPAIWQHYSRGAQESLWYYCSAAEIVRERLPPSAFVDELQVAIQDLEKAISESEDPVHD